MTDRTRDELIAEAFSEDPRPYQDHPEPPAQPLEANRDPDPAQAWHPERDDFTDTAQAFFDLPSQW